MHRTGGRQKRSGSTMCGMSSDGLGVGKDGGQAPANSGSVVGVGRMVIAGKRIAYRPAEHRPSEHRQAWHGKPGKRRLNAIRWAMGDEQRACRWINSQNTRRARHACGPMRGLSVRIAHRTVAGRSWDTG